jgi:F-type H+-transporting ATPase subunit epsilon
VAASDKSFHVSVVTPEGSILEADALSAVFPAFDGQVGILPNHAPLLALLGIGELRVTRTDGREERLYVDQGFAQFVDDKLTLITEDAMPLARLDPEEPARLLDKARELRASGEHEQAFVDAAFERAHVQRRLLEGRRG